MRVQYLMLYLLLMACSSVFPSRGWSQQGTTKSVAPATKASSGKPNTAKATVDENLFLIRNIEHTMQTWRGPETPPVELQTWLTATRTSLSQLRKTAEFDKLDGRVVNAYGDLLTLLDEYEEFLAQADLVTFISDVHHAQASPSSTKLLVLDGASAGGQVGAIAGSFLGPYGSAVGGTGGALLGVLAGIHESFRDCRDKARINHQIDRATKDYIAKRTIELESKFTSAYKTQLLVAHRLAAEKNWGRAVGFEQETLSLDEQRKHRPSDPFLLVQMATQGTNSPIERAKLCFEASKLVPEDRVADVDVYDTFRASFLLVGAEIASHGAFDREGRYDTKLAKGAIRFHEMAAGQVKSPLPIFSYETYANSQAFAGNLEGAAREYAELFNAGYRGRVFLYNYACTCSRRGELSHSLDLLNQSFGSIPRWDPKVLTDPDLINLLAEHREEVEALCKPAVVGKWKNKAMYKHKFEFRDDGTCIEKTLPRTIEGTYQFTSLNRVKVTQPGMMWGSNTGTMEFAKVNDELHLSIVIGDSPRISFELVPD